MKSKAKFIHYHWRNPIWKCRREISAILSRPPCEYCMIPWLYWSYCINLIPYPINVSQVGVDLSNVRMASKEFLMFWTMSTDSSVLYRAEDTVYRLNQNISLHFMMIIFTWSKSFVLIDLSLCLFILKAACLQVVYIIISLGEYPWVRAYVALTGLFQVILRITARTHWYIFKR